MLAVDYAVLSRAKLYQFWLQCEPEHADFKNLFKTHTLRVNGASVDSNTCS